MSKSLGGRPASINDRVRAKLEEAFKDGYNDKQACLYAGIVPSTLYRYQELNPEFKELKEMLKDDPLARAKSNVAKAIRQGNKPVSQWILERRQKDEFSIRTETENINPAPINIISFKEISEADILKLQEAQMKKLTEVNGVYREVAPMPEEEKARP